MKCDFCKLRSEFTCLCEFPFLCSIHLSQHLRQAKNQHIIEPLDICLDTNECQALKNQAQRKIQELQKYKDQTYSLSKILIKKIKKCSKEVTQKIDTQALFYLKLMTLKNLSTSLKAKADKISSSVYVTKDLSLNIEQEIEKVFYQDLFTETSEEEKEDLKKVSEEDKQKKEPQAMNLRFGQYINSWSLDQKRSAIDFEITAPSQTREIRFSKDEKYIFVCRNYIGIFK